jgi:toxin ParE1/3/4
VADIVAAPDVLTRNPMIGRPVELAVRELVIGRGARGYVALYEYRAEIDEVRIAAVRGQREAGY